jgi:hypothetical protein
MSEANSVDDFFKLLKKHGYSDKLFEYSKEGPPPGDKFFKKRFRSKKNESTHDGRPDMVLWNKDKDLIIIVECKKNTKHQGSVEDDEDKAVRYAIPGVLKYMKDFWESGSEKLENVIGIAFSGNKTDHKVAFFGICNAQSTRQNPHIKYLQNGVQFIEYSELLNDLYKFENTNYPGFFCNNTYFCTLNLADLGRLLITKTKFQRPCSEFHVDQIVNSLANVDDKDIRNVGSCCIVVCNNTYHIIDGQHRYEAYKALHFRGHNFNVCLQIIHVDKESEIGEIFKAHHELWAANEIDKNVSERVDKIENILNDLFTQLFTHLGKKYDKLLQTGSHTKAPHINQSVAIPKLIKYFKDKTDKPPSIDKMLEHLDKLNQKIPKNENLWRRPYAEDTVKETKKIGCWLSFIDVEIWFKNFEMN